MHVEQIGPRQYKVGHMYVDLNEMDPCHCADKLLRLKDEQKCKHILAAELYEAS